MGDVEYEEDCKLLVPMRDQCTKWNVSNTQQ